MKRTWYAVNTEHAPPGLVLGDGNLSEDKRIADLSQRSLARRLQVGPLAAKETP